MTSENRISPLIHVGFPKTASTWLQSNIFDNNALGFYSPWGKKCTLAVDQLILGGPYNFIANNAYQQFSNKFYTLKNLTPVISDEILVGDPMLGKYWGKMVADRLYSVFPDARVVICIREQESYLLSAYREYVRGGGTFTLERFIGKGVNKIGFSGIIQKNFLEYDLVVKHYQSLFGKDNVQILPFELLKVNAMEFVRKISLVEKINPVEVNTKSERAAHKMLTVEFMRKFNHFLPPPDFSSSSQPVHKRLLDKAYTLIDKMSSDKVNRDLQKANSEIISQFVANYYVESNRKLSYLVDFDLNEFGYKM